MNQASKRAVLAIAAAGFSALVMGCESLNMDAVPGVQADDATPVVSRARVIAELQEAQRLGLITVGEESVPIMTEEQIRRVAQAGEGAVVAETGVKK